MDEYINEINTEERGIALAVGYSWEKNGTKNWDQLLRKAEALMYEDKDAYYVRMGIERRRR